MKRRIQSVLIATMLIICILLSACGSINGNDVFEMPAYYENRIASLEEKVSVLEKDDPNTDTNLNQPEVTEKLVWYALGDSITQGYASSIKEDGNYDQFVADTENRWVNIVAEMCGYDLHNYGIGGSGYVQGDKNARVLVDTIDFSKCDFVTLAYGVNDWKYAVNIGTVEDIPQTIITQYDGHNSLKLASNAPSSVVVYKNGTLLRETDDYTISGGYIHLTSDSVKGDMFDIYNAEESMVSNMCYVIKKIIRDNPYCKIFVITPINCRSLGSYNTDFGINYSGEASNGLGLSDIYELETYVCEYYGIEWIDMTYCSIINRENIRTMLADYVHPTVECHAAMARELAKKIVFQ